MVISWSVVCQVLVAKEMFGWLKRNIFHSSIKCKINACTAEQNGVATPQLSTRLSTSCKAIEWNIRCLFTKQRPFDMNEIHGHAIPHVMISMLPTYTKFHSKNSNDILS